MSAHRFFLESALPADAAPGSDVILPLSDEDRHHLVSVLRVRVGETIEVVEPGAGSAWTVRVAQTSPVVSATLVERLVRVVHPHVTLVQGVAKGDKMDAIVRQAVEVGASEIIPVLSGRSVVKLDERKRADRGERWRRIAKSAAEQSHRSEVPLVHDPSTLKSVLPLLAAHDEVIVLWEEARGSGLRAAVESWVATPGAKIAVVVGPEGGLSAEEVAELESVGARTVTLGHTILRTETAAIVALALVTWSLGGLGGER